MLPMSSWGKTESDRRIGNPTQMTQGRHWPPLRTERNTGQFDAASKLADLSPEANPVT
jgi:hypothetical protein